MLGDEGISTIFYCFAWNDAAINRDTNKLVSAALELFRNGDVSVTTNGVAAYLPRELPLPHAGFGQDDEWVMANFTNATEILAVGYPQWVDGQVGEGLTNGLYKFTATIGDHELNSYLDGFTYDTNSTPQVHLSLDAPDTILVYTNIYTNAVSGLLSLSMTVDRFRKIQPVRQGLRF